MSAAGGPGRNSALTLEATSGPRGLHLPTRTAKPTRTLASRFQSHRPAGACWPASPPRSTTFRWIHVVKSWLERLQPPKWPLLGSRRRNTAPRTRFIGQQEPRHLRFLLQGANRSPSATLVALGFLFHRSWRFRG